MLISTKWLSKYVELKLPTKEIGAKLTQAGIEVAKSYELYDWGEKVVIGEITSIRKHERADRLRLVTVFDGATQTEVVCGAENVSVGLKIAFAKEGALLYDPSNPTSKTALKKSKIRGFLSCGMVCSKLELGLSDDHENILELDSGLEVGLRLDQIYKDSILEVEPTPNRGDCFSVLGIAREVGALTDTSVSTPEKIDVISKEEGGEVSINIQDPNLCRRFTASTIKGVKIAPSPEWLKTYLQTAGMRPINNLVDITNFVMLEFGQPMHAFDLSKVVGKTINVRKAKKSEVLTTLDGVARKLSEDDLVVCDKNSPIALAGVMGGASSELKESSQDVLLEAANFYGASVRKTALKMGLRTEASMRFEKGLNPDLVSHAVKRALYLITEICGGEVVEFIDSYPTKEKNNAVFLGYDKVQKMGGVAFEKDHIKKTLSNLGFCLKEGKLGWDVEVPYWRNDISLDVDLCEEFLRTIGYDQIPSKPLLGASPRRPKPDVYRFKNGLKDFCVRAGMREIISYPAHAYGADEKVFSKPMSKAVVLKTPVSNEHIVLRKTLRLGLLSTISKNLRFTNKGRISIFECGLIFEDTDGRPTEKWSLSGGMHGPLDEFFWGSSSNEKQSNNGFYSAKGVVQYLLEELGAKEISFQKPDSKDLFYKKNHLAFVVADGINVGCVGEVSNDVATEFGAKKLPIGFFELLVEPLLEVKKEPVYRSIPKFPGSVRDFSIVVKKDVQAFDVEQTIRKHKLVVETTVVSVYFGEDIEADKKVLSIRFVLRSNKNTLGSKAIMFAESKIEDDIKKTYQATLRKQT